MMRMIFIFGLAKKYLQEKKLGHFEKMKNIFENFRSKNWKFQKFRKSKISKKSKNRKSKNFKIFRNPKNENRKISKFSKSKFFKNIFSK